MALIIIYGISGEGKDAIYSPSTKLEIGHLSHSTNHEAANMQFKSRRKEELVLNLYSNKGKSYHKIVKEAVVNLVSKYG